MCPPLLGICRANEQKRGIYEAYTRQVREKELTHLRAGLLMTVVKWGKVDLFERVVQDKNFADQISPALVQQVYARHTLGVHVHRSRCLPPLESRTCPSPPPQAFQLALKLAGNTKQFDVKACTHMIAYTKSVRASHTLHAHLQLIEKLLKLNAKTEDVFVSDLFRRDRARTFSPAAQALTPLYPKLLRPSQPFRCHPALCIPLEGWSAPTTSTGSWTTPSATSPRSRTSPPRPR